MGQNCRENQNRHFMFSNFSFSKILRAVCEVMQKNIAEPKRPEMIIWRMRVACWVPVSTDRSSEYVILTDFPIQQWLNERTSLSRYTYIASVLVIYFYIFVSVMSKIGFSVTVSLSLVCSFVCSGCM